MHSKFKKQIFEEAAKIYNLTYQIGELPGLRKKSEPVNLSEIKSTQTKAVIRKLKKTLQDYRRLTGKGRGVAAIQIGIPLRIAVVYLEKKILTIINPVITKKSKIFLRYPEICMSANPIIAPVIRPEYIEFEYLDESGTKQIWNDHKDRLMNRVFQHEIDHLEGIINIDLVESKELILLSDSKFFKTAKFEEI
jgi:peptide deformylase